jgi:hypothetical protein
MREQFRHHIPISKVKCACYFLIFILIAFLAPSLVIMKKMGGANLNWFETLVLKSSLLSVPLFGLLALEFASKFFDRKAGIIITEQGLFNNSNMFGWDYVKWSEVSAIHLTTIKTGKRNFHMIEVRTRRIDGFSTIKASWFRRFISRKDMFTPECQITLINKQTLAATYQQIVNALRVHQPTPIIDERTFN